MSSNPDFPDFTPVEGGCPCKTIRYSVLAPPLFVHCCHCRWCQRESGAAFALNAWLERENVHHTTSTAPEMISTPTESTKQQDMARCPKCKVCVWSNYGGSNIARFLRVGTLDNPDQFGPDIHIFTNSKQPWVDLTSTDKPVIPEYYDRKKYWPKASLERREKLIAKMKPEQAKTERKRDVEAAEGKWDDKTAEADRDIDVAERMRDAEGAQSRPEQAEAQEKSDVGVAKAKWGTEEKREETEDYDRAVEDIAKGTEGVKL